MRAYYAILYARIAALLQYRAAAIAGLCTQLFWGLIKSLILTAFYAQSTLPQPLSLSQAITFVWLGQGMLQLLPWKLDQEMETQVRSGNISYELVRPLDLYWLFFAKSMAMRIVPTIMRCGPLLLLAFLFFGLASPASPFAAIAFIISFVLAAILSSAITALVTITLFWTLSGEGIQRLLPHVVTLLSGMAVPLPLFPDWMQPFLNVQPFRGVLDIPCRLYTGVIAAEDAFYYLGFQLLWSAILILLGKWLMHRAIKQFVIQGG